MENGINDNILLLIGKTPGLLMQGIARRVKKRRLEKNWTQKALASKAGISLGSYRRFESSGEISLRALVMLAFEMNNIPVGGRYFGVGRFDRTSHGKVHTVSVAGLLHANYRIPSLDYAMLLNLALNLTKDRTQVADLFRLMIFNILISNRDDHAKNFSFQWLEGAWKLSPAYDLLPSSGFNGYHTTTINGQGESALADVVALATGIGLSKLDVNRIIEELTEKCTAGRMAKFRLK